MPVAEFAERYGPWALVAGGSEGIGAAFAYRLAAGGLNLLLAARKPEPLDTLAADIRARHGRQVRTLCVDLTADDALAQVVRAAEGGDIGMLVYNAGADSRVCNFIDRPPEEAKRLVALNVLTPMKLARHFAPAMVERRKGGILLMSSFVSCAGTPGNLVYAATKAFGNVFAEGLWHELGQDGVHVLSVIIGIARTPAMERMGLSFDGLAVPADPYDLVDEALANLDRGPTLHAGGTFEEALRLRSMPRADAVRAVAAFSTAVRERTRIGQQTQNSWNPPAAAPDRPGASHG